MNRSQGVPYSPCSLGVERRRPAAKTCFDGTKPPMVVETAQHPHIWYRVCQPDLRYRFSIAFGSQSFGILRRLALTFVVSAILAACATSRPAQVAPPPPVLAIPQPTPTPQEVGRASWYGPGCHGHKGAAGGYS